MKKIIRNLVIYLSLIAVLLVTICNSGCSFGAVKNPFAKGYSCTITGEPEPITSEDYYQRAIKHAELSNSILTGDFDYCAVAALNESLKLDPNNPKALLMRGFGYRHQQKYDLALADIDKAIQIEPKNPDAYALRASIFELTELIDKAIENQTKAIEFTSKDSSMLHYLYANRGKYYVKKGDNKSAVQDFTDAIHLKPDYKYHYLDRAEAYRKLGNDELAKADEQKAQVLEIDDNPTTANKTKTVSDEILNDTALNLVKPAYPPAARAVRAGGEVKVQVTIDEKGKVISAAAITGHPLLKAGAESAARASTFKTKARKNGIVVFNFAVE